MGGRCPGPLPATARGGAVNGPAGSGSGPDFVVLTGFLGSGKTALLRDFLGGPD
ncbi:GTP-binding protein, partial [Klebsiella pneumoniae]|uniref:GTP-binding protein n=1 Tax=Klebsiella pneumoniae TaxID=573 RepID=UPI001952E233